MTRSAYGGGSIRRRSRDRWQLRWSEGPDPFTGNPVRRAETITAANITEARRELAARVAGRATTSRMALGQLLDATLPVLPIADSTRAIYRHHLKHVPDGARQWVAADITVPDVRRLVEGWIVNQGTHSRGEDRHR